MFHRRAMLIVAAGAAALAVSCPAWGDVTSGLVSRYTFDVDASDAVGSNHGTLENGASIVNDPERGDVLSLDGTDDYVGLPAGNMAAGRSELTLTMWIKPDEWVAANSIYDEHGGDWDEYWQFSIYEGTWYTRDTSTGPTGPRDNDLPVPAVPAGEWHHLAFVYSVTEETKAVYYDGSPSEDTSTSIDQLTSDRAGVGVGYPCDGSYYDGMMDELRLYNRALEPAEIAELASAVVHTLTVNSGSGDGDHAAGVVVAISADPPPSGTGFSEWVGDTTGIANVNAPSTTITMPSSNAEITATYASAYTLTVDSGSGEGQYGEGAAVGISADAPGSGYVFDQWIGDTAAVADTGAMTTTVTMPAADTTVTATYAVFVGYYLTVESGSGDGTYDEGVIVSITADAAPSGHIFNMWAGDPDGFDGWDEMKTSPATYVMPAEHQTLTATYKLSNSPEDWWPYFNAFCKEHFGAELEPLAYDMHGSDLIFLSRSGSEWSHISETSAAIAFETNLPAKTYVEYGQTTSYGSQATIETDRYYYLHLAYLIDLLPDTLYHYRYVAEDERGNIIYSSDKTFTTATPASVIYVPAGVAGPPYNLNLAGRTYLVTEDLVCDRTAFDVQADNITIDLGGRTVTYNEEDYQVSSDFIGTSAFGVRVYDHSNINVVNGTVRQGSGCNDSDTDGIGYNPLFMYAGSGNVSGVTMEYIGGSLKGMALHYSLNYGVHHNVILDRGGYIADRHAGAPYGVRYASNPHHNLLKRVRQNGICGNDYDDVYANEVYVDSCATNSFAISLYSVNNEEVYDNRLFGTGYLVVGLSATGQEADDLDIHDNYVHLQAVKADTRFDEYGAQSGAYCFRITSYGPALDNVKYHDNYGITNGRDGGADGMGGMVRGVWITSDVDVTNCEFSNNVLKAVLTTLDTYTQGCVVHVGTSDPASVPVLYENNRLISNFCNARMGEDYYGAGQNAEFYDNTFVKVGPDRPDYRTIGVGYGGLRSAGHKFYDSVFEGGAGYDQIRFDGTGVRNFSVGWTLTIETEPLNDVTIRDVGAGVVFTGQANGSGICEALLLEYLHEPTGKTYYTPHSVTVDDGVDDRTESVTVDEKKTVQIYIGGHTLTVTNGSGSGQYDESAVVPISADPPDSGKLFARWIGDTSYVSETTEADTTVTMPATDVSVTALYAWGYQLTVNSGTGDGLYLYDAVVDIQAGPAPTNMQFAEWTGDTSQIADVGAQATTFTVPTYDCEVTATYEAILRGDLNGDGFVGQADLDIVLDQWGNGEPSPPNDPLTDPRADPNGDGFVGQADLDIVLDDWGEGSTP